MRGPRNHDEWGILSGFPRCCRIWFKIRLWLIENTSYWSFSKKYMQWFGKKFHFQHVLCPCHHGLALVRLHKPKYFRCKECGWHQFGSGPCRVEALHETWMTRNIIQTHEHFRKHGWKYNGGGQIGKRYRNGKGTGA